MPPTFARPELLASPDWPAEHPPRPATDEFGSAMTGAGVGHGATAILYDDTASLYASRVWWSLRCYGFEGVRVLDGGWAAWVASGGPTSTAAPRPEPAVFTPRRASSLRPSTPAVPAPP